MSPVSLDNLLTRLEEAKKDFSPTGRASIKTLLNQLSRRNFADADELIRFHEALLFLRSHPHNKGMLRRVERLLTSFYRRVEELRQSGADMTAFDYIEYSGIAGTELSDTFTYPVARWLGRRFTKEVSIDWTGYEREDRLAQTLPRFLPLLYEDALVEANVPYLEWLHTAQGRDDRDLQWLLAQFERLRLSEREKTEIYDSLKLLLRWPLDNSPATRTNSYRPVREVFYHRGPLIQRREVSLAREIQAQPLRLKRIAGAQAERMIDMLREATTVRYRELYGITHGDPQSVVRAAVGRGVEIFLWGLPPDRRLPLRAYHAGFTLKNGVPVNYIEGISLFDRMELGFNIFYTFRDGESAWVYAQVLRLLHHQTGVTSISVDPYQIGFHNEEAIESGAFWFYRKLGFRPVIPGLAALTEAEERKMREQPGYRSPARILRRLSAGHIVYEMPGSEVGYWDGFHIRNLGMAVERRAAKRFGGDPVGNLEASRDAVARALEVNPANWKEPERSAFDNLAQVLALIPELARWTDAEKKAVARIIRAKTGADEARYLKLLQRHTRLRDAIRKIAVSTSDVPSTT